MFGWFRRKPKMPPIIDRRHMNEDWLVGDLAECTADPDPFDRLTVSPNVGDRLRVAGVATDQTDMEGRTRLHALMFEGKPKDNGWATQCFRKLRPEIKAADTEFSAELRNRLSQPIRANDNFRTDTILDGLV